VDFWAQHKDFVLKVLAGFGVFLVALIVRSIVYGEDLDHAVTANQKESGSIKSMKLLPRDQIQTLETDAEQLQSNAEAYARRIGWDAGTQDLDTILIERTLSHLRRPAGSGNLHDEAVHYHQTLREDLNGGFGQLRLAVRSALVEEAEEKNISVEGGIGFEDVLQVEPQDLLKYLMQLELSARVLRYAIDGHVDAIDSIQIQSEEQQGNPEFNPEFLREYPVTFGIRGPQEAITSILNRLEKDDPTPPVRGLLVERVDKPRDHVGMELTLLAVATDSKATFAQVGKEAGR
jgi:hypothetical protein